jgi:hypothetical protein
MALAMTYLRSLPPTAVSFLVGPAARAEPPQLLPTRDVDIIYDVTLPSQPRVRERVRWLAADPAGGGAAQWVRCSIKSLLALNRPPQWRPATRVGLACRRRGTYTKVQWSA